VLTGCRSQELKMQQLARPVVPLKEAEQAQVYFHCSRTKKVFVDSRGAVVNYLAEARDQADACRGIRQLPAPQ
jgi:hypothetical protein